MNRIALAMAGTVLALLSPGSAQAGFTIPDNGPDAFAPRDECRALPGAAAFRAALSTAVTRRDGNALAKLAADDVLLDFGGESGPEALRRRLADSEAGDLWHELSQVLTLGCAVRDGALVLPWFFGSDLGDVDPYDTLLVTGHGVPLRAQPAAGAAVKRVLSWQLVAIDASFDPQAPYQFVRLIGGNAEGYVATPKLRNQADYRLIAEMRSGRWKITALVEGD